LGFVDELEDEEGEEEQAEFNECSIFSNASVEVERSDCIVADFVSSSSPPSVGDKPTSIEN